MQDLRLIHSNAQTFNGPEHSVTQRSLYVLNFTEALMTEFGETLSVLEENIQKSFYEDDYDDDEAAGRRRESDGNMELDKVLYPISL